MRLPFSRDAFFDVFVQYNEAVWPMQVPLLALGIWVAVLAVARSSSRSIWLHWPLAVLWLWMALVYHWHFFGRINPAANLFALLFLVQGVLFIIEGWRVPRISLRRGGWRLYAGLSLIAYALVFYPALSALEGQQYPRMVTFGLPCPTTLLTMGVLAIMVRERSHLLIVPVIWGVIGGSASWFLGVMPDLGLLIAALVGVALVLFPDPALPRGQL